MWLLGSGGWQTCRAWSSSCSSPAPGPSSPLCSTWRLHHSLEILMSSFCNMVPSVPCDEVSARGAGAEKRNSSSQASWWIILPEVSNFMFLKALNTFFQNFQSVHVTVSRLKTAHTTHATYVQTKMTIAHNGVYPCPWTSLLTGKRETVYWLAPTRANTLWYYRCWWYYV